MNRVIVRNANGCRQRTAVMITVGQSRSRYFGSWRLAQFFECLLIVVLPGLIDPVNFNAVIADGWTLCSSCAELTLDNRKLGLWSDRIVDRNESNACTIERLIVQRYRAPDRGTGKRFSIVVTSRNHHTCCSHKQETPTHEPFAFITAELPGSLFNRHCDR